MRTSRSFKIEAVLVSFFICLLAAQNCCASPSLTHSQMAASSRAKSCHSQAEDASSPSRTCDGDCCLSLNAIESSNSMLLQGSVSRDRMGSMPIPDVFSERMTEAESVWVNSSPPSEKIYLRLFPSHAPPVLT